jgi:hypothetical protein
MKAPVQAAKIGVSLDFITIAVHYKANERSPVPSPKGTLPSFLNLWIGSEDNRKKQN